MTDTNLDCNKDLDNIKIVYKLPEYFATSCKNYYNKKKEDPEFIKKRREQLKAWREKNRAHVNEVERLRKQKKREEQKANKMVSVIEPVVEPVIEAVKDVKPTETPLDVEQTIVTGIDKIALDTVDKVGVSDQVIKNDDETKTAEKPKAKRGRKRVVVV
jgi:hypothetical protein